jgi:hypothetical protein
MSIDVCRLEVQEKFKAVLSGAHFKELMKDIDGMVDEFDINNPVARKNMEDFIQSKLQVLAGDESRRIMTLEALEDIGVHMTQNSFEGHEADGVWSLLHFSTLDHVSKGANMEKAISVIQDDLSSTLLQAAAKIPGLKAKLASGEMNKAIISTLSGLKNADISPEVKQVAKVIRGILDRTYELKRQAGFNVRYLPNYVGRQYHPAAKIEKLGPEGWKQLARNTMDFKKMGYAGEEIDEFLEQTYKSLTSRNINPLGVMDDNLKSILFPQGKSVEGRRSIHFKEGESLNSYYEGLGVNYMENLIKDIDADARKIGAAQRFGPDFDRGFKSTLQKARVQAKENGTLDKFIAEEKKMQRNFDLMVHGPGHPQERLMAKFGGKTRKLVDMTKLSLALISTVTDFPLAAGVISKTTGKNFLQAQLQVIGEFGKMFKNNKDRMLAGSKLRVFAEDVNVFSMKNRIGEEGQISDFFDKAHQFSMTMTGLPRQALAMRTAISKMFSTDLAEQSHRSFDQLYIGTQDTLNKVGIGAKEWDLIRQNVDDFGDGTKGITPESIADLDISPAQKNKLGQSISAYLSELAELGSPTPGVKRQAWKNSIDPNTIIGQVARFVGQYKSFSLSQLDTMAFISATGKQGGKWGQGKYGNVKLTAATMASSTAMGYLAIAAKDIAKGKQPQDPTTTDAFLRAFAQGGAGLIYADFIMTDLTKYNRSWRNQVLGPGPGLIEDTGKLFHQLVKGNKKAKHALKFYERNSPTLPFSRAILGTSFHEAIFHSLNGDMDKIKPFRLKD